MTREELIEQLNNTKKGKRLSALKKLKRLESKKVSTPPKQRLNDANIHLCSFYSFSPYSPSKAAFMAYRSGLITLGLVDHDTLKGATEFLKACDILNCAGTVGFESRVYLNDEKIEGIENINNDTYLLVHGVPKSSYKKMDSYLEKLRIKRLTRCKKLLEIINDKFSDIPTNINFESDIKPLSKNIEGGSVTERHILYALSLKLIQKFNRGESLVQYLIAKRYAVDELSKAFLSDINNPYYEYDLLYVLKGNVKSFYNPSKEECVSASELIDFANSLGGVTTYPYNQNSFNEILSDDELENLIIKLKDLGVNAVSYLPDKITNGRVKFLQTLCEKYGLLELCSEEINSPRQKFENVNFKKEKYQHLIKSVWAIIGHEKMSNLDKSNGMFTEKAVGRNQKLDGRIDLYAQIGKNFYKI